MANTSIHAEVGPGDFYTITAEDETGEVKIHVDKHQALVLQSELRCILVADEQEGS